MARKTHIIDDIDEMILSYLYENEKKGLIEISKIIDMSPRSLLVRLKKYYKSSWIKEKTISTHPSGRKRIYSLTQKGIKVLRILNNLFDKFL